MSVFHGEAGFPKKYLESGVNGLTFKISAEQTLIILRPITEQRYLNKDVEICAADGWIDTGNVVEIAGDRVFFQGRLNGSINVDGNKVPPEEVEQTILQLPEISAVSIVAKSSSITGPLVEAQVVPTDSEATPIDIIKVVKSHCRTHLADFKLPLR